MSSKFPSLEEIDQDIAPSVDSGSGDFIDFTNNDSNDDFLSREKAALGADASEFQTSEDAGFGGGDEISGFNASFPALATSVRTTYFLPFFLIL